MDEYTKRWIKFLTAWIAVISVIAYLFFYTNIIFDNTETGIAKVEQQTKQPDIIKNKIIKTGNTIKFYDENGSVKIVHVQEPAPHYVKQFENKTGKYRLINETTGEYKKI